MKGLRRDRERSKRKGALLRSVSVNLAELRRVLEIDRPLLRSVSVNLAELSPLPRLRRTRRRVFKVKGARLRPVSVNLAELPPLPRLRRTRRRVLKMKGFWFMGKIVTDRVGHWWG